MYPVDAVTVKLPLVDPVGVPVMRPREEMVIPVGMLVLRKEMTGRSERVVAVS